LQVLYPYSFPSSSMYIAPSSVLMILAASSNSFQAGILKRLPHQPHFSRRSAAVASNSVTLLHSGHFARTFMLPQKLRTRSYNMVSMPPQPPFYTAAGILKTSDIRQSAIMRASGGKPMSAGRL